MCGSPNCKLSRGFLFSFLMHVIRNCETPLVFPGPADGSAACRREGKQRHRKMHDPSLVTENRVI